MRPSRFLAQAAFALVLVLRANAESHVIRFVNKCGYGSPALMYNGKNILTSDSYTSEGPFSGIAYLQTGYCNTNGENCTLLETTLINPTCAGCGSSTDLSLISPHAYSVETSFAYYNGCDGIGKTCSNSRCTSSAFFAPNDNFVQVACQTNNVDLLVAFCADAAQFVSGNSTGSSPTNSPPLSSHSTSASLGHSKPSPTHILEPLTRLPSTTPTPTPTPTPTDVDDTECGDDPETTAPLLAPTAVPSGTDTECDEPEETTHTPAPTQMPTQILLPSGTDAECGDEPETTTPPSSPTPTPTATPSGTDPGCDEFGESTTPMQTQTPIPSGTDTGCDESGEPSGPSTPTPTQTATDGSDPGCDELGQTAPISPSVLASTPTTSPTQTPLTISPSPTTSRRRCRPRPTGLSPYASAPTNPAYTPKPTYTPATTTTPKPSAGTPDPCDDLGDTSMPSQAPTNVPRRRRHYRTNRMSH